MPGAPGEIGKARILRQIGPFERFDEPDILLLTHQCHDDPAIAGAVGAGRHVQLPRRPTLENMLSKLVAEDRRGALREADLEPPAPATALARIKRDTEGLRRIETGQGVDDDRPDPVRGAVIAEIDRHQPGKGLRHRIGAGQG